MAQTLMAPIGIASILLCVAGLAKLRSPMAAARALRDAGLPGGARTVRAFAACELALGIWSLAAPARASAALECAVYALFAVVSARLARRAASCGCFGTDDAPASISQSILSIGFALLAGLAVGWPAPGVGWALSRPPLVAVTLVLGLIGGAYAAVLAYTELPAAWGAWEGAS